MGIILKDIRKVFEGKTVIDNVNFEINDHEFICMLGPSGCGKSTLLNMIAGLDMPTSGDIIVDGTAIKAPSNDRVMMFQAMALFPWLTVIENIKFGLKIKKYSKEEQEAVAMKYLKLVNLEEYRDYNVHKLSGGMQQRVALARSLAVESKYLLMDEPFASLDKQTINILREELESIWRMLKNTIIYVTHSVEEALFFADRIIMFSTNPCRIKKVFDINMPRPRRVSDDEMMHLRIEILEELRQEVITNEENIINY